MVKIGRITQHTDTDTDDFRLFLFLNHFYFSSYGIRIQFAPKVASGVPNLGVRNTA